MPISTEGRQEIALVLRRQHGKVVKQIEDLLNGQDVKLDNIPTTGFVDETPLESLRRFMRLIDEKRKTLDAPDFGRCRRCGAEIDERSLVAMPWADTCRACAGKG